MIKAILILYLVIFLFKCEEIKYNHSDIENNLYFVLSSFRHGARQCNFNKDIFNNFINDTMQITSYGAKQHLIIGQTYRKRYFNFLNLKNKNFKKRQIFIKTSNIKRALISVKMQLEGLFNSSINDIFINYINWKDINNNFNLYTLKIEHLKKLKKYFNSCKLRKLKMIYNIETFKRKIIPLFKKCYGKLKTKNLWDFCDNTISSFFEYSYNKKNNNIGKCGYKTAKILYNFCINYYNSFRDWNEKAAYMFYYFFSDLFQIMKKTIDGLSKLKMIMIGGHDTSVSLLMDFLNGMKIIKRNEYPHYAFNILFELRKYNTKFYLEIYYNDILKYNQTLLKFKNLLDKSKYSNLYNYCGFPLSGKNNINKKIFYNKTLKTKKNLYFNNSKNDFFNYNIMELKNILAFTILIYSLLYSLWRFIKSKKNNSLKNGK